MACHVGWCLQTRRGWGLRFEVRQRQTVIDGALVSETSHLTGTPRRLSENCAWDSGKSTWASFEGVVIWAPSKARSGVDTLTTSLWEPGSPYEHLLIDHAINEVQIAPATKRKSRKVNFSTRYWQQVKVTAILQNNLFVPWRV